MIIRMLTFLAVFGLFSTIASAQSAADIKQRMSQRLPVIDELKAKQIVGENNRGFIEIRQASPGADTVVTEENRDREAVYASIAKQTGTSADAVAVARAKKIAENSRSGVWLQDESGKWYKK